MEVKIIDRYDAGDVIEAKDSKSGKRRPFLIISNDRAAIQGDSDYVVLKITSKNKRTNYDIDFNWRKVGLDQKSIIRSNKFDSLSKEECSKYFGSIEEEKLNDILEKCGTILIRDKESEYNRAFRHWLKAYNIIKKSNYKIDNAPLEVRDKFNREIAILDGYLRLVFHPDYLAKQRDKS
ncbi:type II toxin-antitoxin system PemK/MazF family toxin [Paenibacillus piscarius]|uniref:type II toxin-antitoxin system PemK/MazF family toxin n=1 Tax=Paenibacillus piscarius TaxID=1089681 RepID=UPI001EE85779|nr:type II toxin-antitoxin system PemK/MazF family toxin [Paenibacillus piscarius]